MAKETMYRIETMSSALKRFKTLDSVMAYITYWGRYSIHQITCIDAKAKIALEAILGNMHFRNAIAIHGDNTIKL